MDITKTKEAKKIISKFAEVDYKVVSAGKFNDGNENFVWTEKDYKDEICTNVGMTQVSDEVKKKRNIKSKKIFGVDSETSYNTTTHYTIKFESDDMMGYVILKVRDGIFLNKARNQFTRELNNEVSLCEVGWSSKAMFKDWGYSRQYSAKVWNDLLKQSKRFNDGTPYFLRS
tara:strand:- start:45 stop:560 length:516 start_codon:yes stop_codon:yes gene_type:complete